MTEYVYKRENICDGVYSIERTGEQIVRCRDCVHYADHEWITSPQYGLGSDFEHVCHFWHGKPTKVAPNGFCAWGKRKAMEQ